MLQRLVDDGWTHFDDLVFKLSAGALAISVTFIGVLKTPPHAMRLLFAACCSCSLCFSSWRLLPVRRRRIVVRFTKSIELARYRRKRAVGGRQQLTY